MPISPLHLGPGILQKAVAPEVTDLRLYAIAILAIDVEPIFKGVTELAGLAQWDSLHTWTHQPWGITAIVLSCAVVWVRLRLSKRWAAFWTAVGAGVTHWLLDSLMHGGGDLPRIWHGYGQYDGSWLAHTIVAWTFLIGGVLLLWEHWSTVRAWTRRELRW